MESIFIVVVSVVLLVLSSLDLKESVIELSVFTVVVSVVELEDPDPQAAKIQTSVTVSNFFIFNGLK